MDLKYLTIACNIFYFYMGTWVMQVRRKIEDFSYASCTVYTVPAQLHTLRLEFLEFFDSSGCIIHTF